MNETCAECIWFQTAASPIQEVMQRQREQNIRAAWMRLLRAISGYVYVQDKVVEEIHPSQTAVYGIRGCESNFLGLEPSATFSDVSCIHPNFFNDK